MQTGFFLQVLFTVFSLVILCVPGFLLAKFKIFDKQADKVVSALVLYGCQPFLMFMAFQKTSFSLSIAKNMLIVAGIAVLIHGMMIAFTYLVIRNKDNPLKKNVVRFASVFGNCGYMGLPFLSLLFNGTSYQGEVLIYGGVIIGVFNVLTWTVGIFMVTGDKKQMSVKNGLLNPTVIGLIIGLIVFVAVGQPLRNIGAGTVLNDIMVKLMSSFNYLAEMVTPLAMTVIGIKMANIKFTKLFTDVWAYIVCANKLIIASVLTMITVAFLPISTVVKYALFFGLSMPSATNTVLFAVRFGGDSESGSVFVLLSTLMSVITIPLMFLLFNGVFGVSVPI